MKFVILFSLMMMAVHAEDHHHNIDPNHFADYLKRIEMSSQFLTMDKTQKDMFSNMILAAEKGPTALEQFVENVHFETLLKLIARLDEDDIPIIERYLGLHLQPSSPITKRQTKPNLSQWIDELHTIYKLEDHMDDRHRQIFREMMFAADHNQMTKFIDDHGYGAIFMIMSYVDHDYARKLDQLVIEHLQMEAAMGIHHQTPTSSIVG